MAYMLFSLLLFCASVFFHVLFCRRTSTPGLHARVFIYIALFFLAVYILGVYLVGQKGPLDPRFLWGMPFKTTAGIIFVLLAPMYLFFYVRTQLTSPSKTTLLCLYQHGSLSYAQILKYIQEEDFINTRLTDLITSGCVRQAEGRYTISPSGLKIAMVLKFMQMLLGRGMGG